MSTVFLHNFPANQATPNDHVVQSAISDEVPVYDSLVHLQEVADAQQRALGKFPSNAKGTRGTKYRFRAECPRDADLFLRAISRYIEPSWTMTPLGWYPDVEVTFTLAKNISPRSLLWIACVITDGHVLVQTLEKEGEYTGKRDYFREIDIQAPRNIPSPKVLSEMKKGLAWYVDSLEFLLGDAKDFAVILAAASSGN
jgi:hypothetical protein